MLGKTNDHNIDTRYSPRKPDAIQSVEIIQERLESAQRKLTLPDALNLAVTNSRTYQFQKESLYLIALTLTRDRYDFRPHFAAGTTATATRDFNGEQSARLQSHISVAQLLKDGTRLSLSLANDLLHFYTGGSRSTAASLITANVSRPLLRGGGADIVAENLTQSERNVVYEIRSFSRFQKTFAVNVVTAYWRLLQQKDAIRNEYDNYKRLVTGRERARALAEGGKLPNFQVDQAQQDELRAKSRYITAVEEYQNRLDDLKQVLGLPLGVEISLDDGELQELFKAGLIQVNVQEHDAYEFAVAHRLDLMNEIDRFEDSQRKIKVAADALKPELNIFTEASFASHEPTDYAQFDLNNYRAQAGVELNLPLDRLKERNVYRVALISFERQIRALALALDQSRNDVRDALRALDQTRQNYQIQRSAVELADGRVDSVTLFVEAGRAQIRDLLEAQNAQLQARNALSLALVDYHVARLNLLLDIELLETGEDHFWLKESPQKVAPLVPPQPTDEVIPPEKLFRDR